MSNKPRSHLVKLKPLFIRIPEPIKKELERIYPLLGYKDLSELVRDILRQYINNLRTTKPELFTHHPHNKQHGGLDEM